MLYQMKTAYLSTIALELANSEFDQQVLYEARFRDFRSQMEHIRGERSDCELQATDIFDNLDGKFLARLREISFHTRTMTDGKSTITFKTSMIEANYSPDIIIMKSLTIHLANLNNKSWFKCNAKCLFLFMVCS